MSNHKLSLVVAGLLGLPTGLWADTLTFIPQFDSGSGVTNYSWFSSLNWFTAGSDGLLVGAGRVPLTTETAIVNGMADGDASGVRIRTLVLTNSAALTNGTFAIENLQMLSQSSCRHVTLSILTSLQVGGTNCAWSAANVNILAIATGVLSPLAPAPAATLELNEGSQFLIGGQLRLTDGSQIAGGGAPQCRMIINPGAILSSTNSALVRGSTASPGTAFIIDNSGLIRVDGGTLTFGDNLDWQSTWGSAEFRAVDSTAQLLFDGPFQVPAAVTDFFTGSGTNRLAAGGTIDGTAQVGMVAPDTQVFTAGNLEVLDSVGGTGIIHVLGDQTQTGVLSFLKGALSLPSINVDAQGAMVFTGGAGTARSLSGSMINNSGHCTMLNGDLALDGGATINNLSTGIFEVQAPGTISGVPLPTGGAFNNTGVFLKSGPGNNSFGSTNSVEAPDFNNDGLVNVTAGQLSISGGASSGEFRAAVGSLLWFWGGTHTLANGASLTGAGSARLQQGVNRANWLVTGPLNGVNVEVGSNGTVIGSGGGNLIQLQNLTASGNALLTNGNFQIQDALLRDAATVAGSAINIVDAALVSGTNCSLDATTFNLPPNASMTLAPEPLSAPALVTLAKGSTLLNSGRLILADGSRISGGASPQSKLVVQLGGILSSTNLAMLQGNVAAPLIIDNSGLVRVDSGTLTFGDSIDWRCASGSAEFRTLLPGSLVLFSSGFHAVAGTTSLFTGPGTNRWAGGAMIDGIAQVGASGPVGSPFASGNLEILSPVVGLGQVNILSGGPQAGVLSWTDGALSMSQLNIGAGAVMLLTGGNGTSRSLSGCTLNNSGLCRLLDGDLNLNSGATINNLPGATFLMEADAAIGGTSPPITGTFNNLGTFHKNAGAGLSTMTAGFSNLGSLVVHTGTLNFLGPWVQSAGSTVVELGAVLAGNTLAVQGGTIAGTGEIDAQLNNGGTVGPGGSPGVLFIGQGKDYQQMAQGTLVVELGGLNPGTQFDQLAVSGAANLNGRLELHLLNAYTPRPGDTFRILTCASQTGTFASLTASPPPRPDTAWVPRYNGTNVTLVLASQVTIQTPVLDGGQIGFSFPTMVGINYLLQKSDSLTSPNWQTLTAIKGDGTTKIVSGPATGAQWFFRIELQ